MEGEKAPLKLANLGTLPADILSPITSLLSGSDTARLVICGSKRFTNTLCRHGGVTQLNLRDFCFKPFPRLFCEFSGVEYLEANARLSDLVRKREPGENRALEDPYRPIFPRLKKLSLQVLLEAFPHYGTQASRLDFASSFPSLSELHLETRHSLGVLELPSSLSSLTLNTYESPNRYLLAPLPEHLTHISIDSMRTEIPLLCQFPKNVVELLLPGTSLNQLYAIDTQHQVVPLYHPSKLTCSAMLLPSSEFSGYLHSSPNLTYLCLKSLPNWNLSTNNIQWPSGLTHLYLFGGLKFDDESFAQLPRGLLRFGTSCSLEKVSTAGFSSLPRTLQDLSVSLTGNTMYFTQCEILASVFAKFIECSMPPTLTRLYWQYLGTIMKSHHVEMLPPNLTSLTLWTSAHLSSDNLLQLPAQLVTLRLTNFSKLIQCKHAKAMPKTLKILSLRGYSCYLDPLVLSLLPIGITDLDLSGHSTMSNRQFAALPPALKSFSATLCADATAVGVSLLPRSLTFLDLTEWRSVSGEAIATLPRSITELKISGASPSAIAEDHLLGLPPQLTALSITYPNSWSHLDSGIANKLPKSLTSVRFKKAPKLLNLSEFSLKMPRLGSIVIEKVEVKHIGPLVKRDTLKELQLKDKLYTYRFTPTWPTHEEKFAFEEYDASPAI